MELKIRFTAGPFEGRTLTPKGNRIVFGRDPQVCNVLFPEDTTQVGRRHCALTLMMNEYRLGIFKGYLVTVDGQKARDGQRLHSGAVCQLGPSGPRFVVEYEKKEDRLLSTLTQHAPRRTERSWLSRLMRRTNKKS